MKYTNQATGEGLRGIINLTSAQEGFTPITGEVGRRDMKKDLLTVSIEKINEKYGTSFSRNGQGAFTAGEQLYEQRVVEGLCCQQQPENLDAAV